MMMMMMMIMFVLLMVMLTICDSQMVDKFVFSLTLDMQFKVHDIIIYYCSNMFQIMLSKVGPNLYVFYWDSRKVCLQKSGRRSRRPTVVRCWVPPPFPLIWPWPSQPVHPAASPIDGESWWGP